MKKRILSILLCLCMAAALMPTTALAWTRPDNIEVNNATYYSNGALKEITAGFDWYTASASSRLVLMTERLRSACEAGTNSTWGDFTDLGFYGSNSVHLMMFVLMTRMKSAALPEFLASSLIPMRAALHTVLIL